MVPNPSLRPHPHDPDPLVLYHGRNCPDGFAAALAAWLYFGGRGQYLSLDHGDVRSVDDLPPLTGRSVYILDFSFDEPVLRQIAARASTLVMLDHHRSAADQLGDFACSNGAVHFDMGKSGARLAWEYFLPERSLPALVRHVEDRDIWTWKLPDSAAFLAALDMEPMDFARWRQIADFSVDELADFMARGDAMDRKFTSLAEQIAEAAQPLRFNGIDGLMVNAPGVFHSLVGELLSRRSGTFALMWSVDRADLAKCGLRSQPGFDCIPLASSMGGGGHAQACGFKLPLARLPELLTGRLDAR